MLILLKNVNDGNVFYLLNKNEFVVGRKECDFLIPNDQSISRRHAILRLKDGKVTLEDCGAKYNTRHKEEKLIPNVEVPIEYNDIIQFGVINSKYRLEKHEFVTTGTRLNNSQKNKLKSDLETLGGQYIENWTSVCTHLTVEEVTLTVKVLHALIDEKPIVRPAYWTKFAENVRKKLPPPTIANYNSPRIAEALLNQIELRNNPQRKVLFKGKLFVFLKEKNKKQMEEIIRKAGGTSISWEKNPMPLEDVQNSPKEFLIIQTPDFVHDDNLNDVIKLFSKQGKRTIPLQEIAMSIVLCSCEKDCNPNFNRVEQVFPTTGPLEPTQNNALVPDTESENFSMRKCKQEDGANMIVPDTMENELLNITVPFKMQNLPSTSSNKGTDKDVSEIEDSKRQVLKRSHGDKLEENPLKKSKLDNIPVSGQNQMSTLKQEKRDGFLSKSVLPQKRMADEDILKSNDTTSVEKSNPFAFFNKNKKTKSGTSSKTDNPFNLLKKNNDIPQVSEENPFKLCSGKKKRGSDDISNLSVCKKKKEEIKDRIFSSTVTDNNPDKVANFSNISRINSTGINPTWMSKKLMSNYENIENNFDTEMQQFVDQFKDTVVVEIMAKLTIRTRILEDEIDGDVSKGKHNFKRFRKVMPLRPQRTIIAKENFVALGPGDTTGIADSRKEFHMSDDESDGNVKTKKKPPKRFYI